MRILSATCSVYFLKTTDGMDTCAACGENHMSNPRPQCANPVALIPAIETSIPVNHMSNPMSGMYAIMESARVCCHATRTNGPLSGTGYAVTVTHTNGPPT